VHFLERPDAEYQAALLDTRDVAVPEMPK